MAPAPLLTPRLPLRLALVGTGALGAELCRLLLEQGRRDVLLIDPDLLAEHNLPLSILFAQAGPTAVGRLKCEVLAEWARSKNYSWKATGVEIADVGLLQLAYVDALVCCTDSALSRVEATYSARALGVPLYDAGVQSEGVDEGRVALFAPEPAAACYLCGLPEARRAELLAFAVSASLGCALPVDAAARPMTGTSRAIEATAAALLELLAQPPSRASYAQRIVPGQPPQTILLPHSATCPWHGPRRLQPLPHDVPLSNLLAPGIVLELPWPVCLKARCRRCDARFKPLQRVALVRRRLLCPVCGAGPGALEALETLQTIAHNDPWAQHTLEQLGLPAGQLYHLRAAMLAHEGGVQQLIAGKEPRSERHA